MKLMKIIGTKIRTAAPILCLAFCLLLAGCAKLPDDGADAEVMRFDNCARCATLKCFSSVAMP